MDEALSPFANCPHETYSAIGTAPKATSPSRPSDGAKDNVLIYVESFLKFCDLVLVDKDDFVALPYISDPNQPLHEVCQGVNKREAAVVTKSTENLSVTEEWLNSAHPTPSKSSISPFSPPSQSFLIARILTSRQQRTLMMICISSSWPA